MKLYSNEIVFPGHPDKVCDQISAAILDECLKQDPFTRAGIECAGGKGILFITGEVATKAHVDVKEIAAGILKDMGYPEMEIIVNISRQSEDIALGVDVGGAGDNGMMFGYACNDTEEKLPLAMVILQKFARGYDALRREDSRFRSDGKAQITGIYDDDFKLTRIKDFTICYQNDEQHREETDEILRTMALRICGSYGIEVETFYINPTGKFELGGFAADAGLTGRKIVVDSYQSFANVGGGCMNGKDPTKVDVSGAYMARVFACELLEKEDLQWCEVQLSYAIGIDRPLAIYVDSDKGNLEAPEEFYDRARPNNIIKELDLRAPSWRRRAMFGHFTGAC